MSLALSRPILYLITRGATTETTSPNSGEFQDILVQVSAAVAAGIELIQLREKRLTARVLFELTKHAVALTRGTTTQILVNDRADIAAGAGADGVHLTTQSLDAATVRRTFGPQLLIGASTHSLAEVNAAHEASADFVVFGPVFETSSKQQYGPPGGAVWRRGTGVPPVNHAQDARATIKLHHYGPPLGLEKLRDVTRALPNLAVLALGGVFVNNARDCISAGASGIAGISLFSNPKDLDSSAVAIREAARNTSEP